MSSSPLPPAMLTAGRIAAWVLGGFLILLIAITAWVGVRGVLAYQHLSRIEAGIADASSALASEPAAAGATLARLASDASAAHDLTSDPVWHLAERTPWIGPQLSAFATVAAAGDTLLSEALLPLVTAAQDTSFDALKPVNGRIDTTGLSALAEPAQSAAAKSAEAAEQLGGINRVPLVGVVSRSVDKSTEVFNQAANGLDALSRATRLLPGLLGQNGERNYLVVVQNNAEWRSLGGIAGTAILLKTNEGAISLAGTESGTSLSSGIKNPVVDLPADVQGIYETRPARFFQNLTQIPDFTFDGPLAREMYRQRTGVDVNGVISLDPVVLSYLLKATGPVTLPDGETLSADNAVQMLLSDVYQRYKDPGAQDAFFAGATGAVFNAFLEGRGSTVSLFTGLATAADQRRVLMWSADPAEQDILEGSSVAGDLPITDGETARFGVYFNDGGGSKMSYYVKPEVSLAWDQCSPDDRNTSRQLSLRLSLANTAPADAATSLPTYVTANGAFGTAPGTATVVNNIYLPEGWELVSATTSDGTGFTTGSLKGRQVLTFGFSLLPQTSGDLTVVVRETSTAANAEAIVTPTADATINPTVEAECSVVPNATLG
ncbi:DUF4012 domain-containing protein [Microbacterium sp. SL62]|uniref:DUF4012 domain-containing protein n=1 Tax=Microbacterium sp. SL62 TaxID=2995139 RepID=UPI0022759B9B|nr:DUF4012 domain-containing protein [Microbacterium sp. SL62]MCY1717626.1 DUF4012 domain-containing protein [Microbacterium sp. SL62]